MGLRDALVRFEDDETPTEFIDRAMRAAAAAGGSGRLRLEVGPAFTLRDGKSYASVSLWVERGRGLTESWQRVTGSVMDDSYGTVLAVFASALDAARR